MEPRLRMKDLVEQTGMNKSTILHYVHMGLLPEPNRTFKNMAYYPPVYLTLLPIIRTLQSQYHLPLEAIKQILDHLGPAPSMERALRQYELFYKSEAAPLPEGDRTYDRDQFLTISGLSEEQLKGLEGKDLILPLENGLYNEDDRMMAQIFRELQDLAIPWTELEEFTELSRRLALQSQAFFDSTVKGRNPDEFQKISRLLSGSMRNFLLYLLRRNLRRIIQGDRS